VAVRVTAISHNRGETRRAVHQAEPGWRRASRISPGWPRPQRAMAAGPNPAGAVGLLPSSAWAERVNCRTHTVAASSASRCGGTCRPRAASF
jgi:hypothetical protein